MADVIPSTPCDEGGVVEIEVDGAPVSDANPLPISIVQGGDFEIGAVEIKSGDSDNRAQVDLPANLTSTDLVLGVHDPGPVNNQAADGAAVAGNPVRVGGKDGAGNTQDILTDTTGNLIVVGSVAADAPDSGNPVKIGGKAVTAQPTAVAADDRVDALLDLFGRQVVQHALRSSKGRQRTVITSSAAETTIVTANATNFLDLYGLVLTNTSSTVCDVDIRDATAGTIVTTITVPADDTRGFMLPASDGYAQAALNNNWTATCTSVASMTVTAMFVRNSAA